MNFADLYGDIFGNGSFRRGGLLGYEPLSAAGRELERIRRSDEYAASQPVTDELVCALKRAAILAGRL